MNSKIYSFLLSIVCAIVLTSCGSDLADVSYFNDFLKYNEAEKAETLSETVSLFVDYSTCVAEAKKSTYFKSTHPSIVDCSPVFYSIKGDKIKKETEDRQQVYNLLSIVGVSKVE